MNRKIKGIFKILILLLFVVCNGSESPNIGEKSSKSKNVSEGNGNCKEFEKYNASSKKIELKDRGLKEIKCISKYVNVKEVDLRWNEIEDLSPMENLKKLEVLKISFNNVSDITPILNLTNLKELWIHNNKIENLKGIEKLSKLEHLDISYNPLKSSIKEVTGLKNLKRLEVRGAPEAITDYIYNNSKEFSYIKSLAIEVREDDLNGNNLNIFSGQQRFKRIESVKFDEVSENELPETVRKKIKEAPMKIEDVKYYRTGVYEMYYVHYHEENTEHYRVTYLFKNGRYLNEFHAFESYLLESREGDNLYEFFVAVPGYEEVYVFNFVTEEGEDDGK